MPDADCRRVSGFDQIDDALGIIMKIIILGGADHSGEQVLSETLKQDGIFRPLVAVKECDAAMLARGKRFGSHATVGAEVDEHLRWCVYVAEQQIRHVGVTGAEHQIGIRMEHAVDDALCDLGTGRGKAGEVDIIGGPADEYRDDEDYRRVQQPLARAVRVHFRDGELAVESLFEHFYLVFLTHCASPFSSASCEDIR